MRTARITSHEARNALDLATDSDICAAQREDDMRTEQEEIDRLIEEVDREIAAEQHVAMVRLAHEFTDQRRAWRAARRAGREVLRSLPTRLDVAELADGEAA